MNSAKHNKTIEKVWDIESIGYIHKQSPNLTNSANIMTNADDIIAFYNSRHVSSERDYLPTTILIAISGFAIISAFSVAMASAIYRQRKKLCAPSKVDCPTESSFTTETEFNTWDSLSFSCSATDFQTSKMQFRSVESLSDDSYINSLDEAISHKASIVHKKSLKGAPQKIIVNTTASQLSVDANGH